VDIICIMGEAPGPVTATVSHCGEVRQVRLTVARHAAGGWQVRSASGLMGLRCHSVRTAVLLEAAEIGSRVTAAPIWRWRA
jgi:hypothetical protein